MASLANPEGESLFEKLVGRYSDGTKLETLPLNVRRTKSIADHLTRMLNTRQGSVPHLPDYGIPDIAEIYRMLPGSMKQLEEMVLRTVKKYEPRLNNVRIREIATEANEFRLAFEVMGNLSDGSKIALQTSFTSIGQTNVSQRRLN